MQTLHALTGVLTVSSSRNVDVPVADIFHSILSKLRSLMVEDKRQVTSYQYVIPARPCSRFHCAASSYTEKPVHWASWIWQIYAGFLNPQKENRFFATLWACAVYVIKQGYNNTVFFGRNAPKQSLRRVCHMILLNLFLLVIEFIRTYGWIGT